MMCSYRLCFNQIFILYNVVVTINDISRSVGYDDTLGFSKIFKKGKRGIS